MIFLMCISFSTIGEEYALDCDHAKTTIDMNECAALELNGEQEKLNHYLEASLKHYENDLKLVQAIQTSQKDWETYLSSHCSAIYTQWRDGSIRSMMSLSCKIKLTKQRTHEIWESYLTFMDSTPPILEEPH